MRPLLNKWTTYLVMVAILSLMCIAPRLAHAGATVTVVNNDGANEGFNDPSPPDPASTDGGNNGATLGAQRLNAFQFAADIWGAIINSSVDIRVAAQMDPLACGPNFGILGAAGPVSVFRGFAGAPVANTWYPAALANSLADQDLDPRGDDIGATFNSDVDDDPNCLTGLVWYYGLDANSPNGTIDFVTTILHEIGHGLGFLTFVDLATGQKLLGRDDAFMRYLENHATGELYPDMTNGERVNASVVGRDLHWVGDHVVDSSSGLTSGRHASGHVEMYAPDPQEPGSSVSHFSTSLSPDELMEPFETGASHATGLTGPLLQDIGWSVTDGPPPPPPPSAGGCDCRDPKAIRGTPGAEILIGTSGDDIICGFGGDDRIFGLSGNDCLSGGAGDDELRGGPGDDELRGGPGNDALYGGSGNDRLYGRQDNDTLLGRSDDDELHGGPGDDELHGGPGNDLLNGDGGSDDCRGGGGGNDTLRNCNP